MPLKSTHKLSCFIDGHTRDNITGYLPTLNTTGLLNILFSRVFVVFVMLLPFLRVQRRAVYLFLP